MTKGVEQIAAERARQIRDKGYDHNHDDQHGDGELLDAAVDILRYTQPHSSLVYRPDDDWSIIKRTEHKLGNSRTTDPNPTRIRLLVIAGALIAAEIDRLERLNASIYAERVHRGLEPPK